MSAAAAFSVVTIFWLIVGIAGPVLVNFVMKRSPNKGIVQTMLVTTAVCCYLFWLCTFLSQYNPLTAPQLEKNIACFIRQQWDGDSDIRCPMEEE
ncbi:V-type proton ATPase subunit e 2-like [Sycon ciliatum]|uniref:V-type proton ATPase subunit e 2-like n=1 Tax=Sycon ciliatum TaxID=27933 RepID=UPI0031F68F33